MKSRHRLQKESATKQQTTMGEGSDNSSTVEDLFSVQHENGIVQFLVAVADPNKSGATTKSSGSVFSFVIGQVETFLMLFEYLLILVFVNLAWESIGWDHSWTKSNGEKCLELKSTEILMCTLQNDAFPVTASLIKVLLATGIICSYMLFRFSRFQGVAFHSIFERGMKLSRGLSWSQACSISLVSMLVEFFVLHYCLSGFRFSSFTADNYRVSGRIDYAMALEILFSIPLKEELLFRLVVNHTLFNRLKNKHLTAWASAFWFGLFHLLNLFQTRFSVTYVYLQVFIAFYMGLAYNYIFIKGSIMTTIILHCLNNILNSLSRADFESIDSCMALQVSIQCIVHCALSFTFTAGIW
eukprot:TRINITY_DN9761_c0_g1_i2.p1 TRINITY_DN9761_c0_g1~~TRINITY_DN9761_c0_g1_i2.p1  ORF type:complete len:355 (-),score=54.90 TRINITY_DN9761_c0_g1_i2:207-1271(-)